MWFWLCYSIIVLCTQAGYVTMMRRVAVAVVVAAEGVVAQEGTGSGVGSHMKMAGVKGEGHAQACALGWCVQAACSAQRGPQTAVQVAAAA
jgi:hypothetical protein